MYQVILELPVKLLRLASLVTRALVDIAALTVLQELLDHQAHLDILALENLEHLVIVALQAILVNLG